MISAKNKFIMIWEHTKPETSSFDHPNMGFYARWRIFTTTDNNSWSAKAVKRRNVPNEKKLYKE